jgi:hypothetical protein
MNEGRKKERKGGKKERNEGRKQYLSAKPAIAGLADNRVCPVIAQR